MYKVVLERDGEYFSISSAWMLETEMLHDHLVRYAPGEWTHPTTMAAVAGYGLCFFEELSDAIEFVRVNETIECTVRIFEIRVLPAYKDLPAFGGTAFREAVNGRKRNPEDSYSDWPDGTKMTDGIMLLEEVPLPVIIQEAKCTTSYNL